MATKYIKPTKDIYLLNEYDIDLFDFIDDRIKKELYEIYLQKSLR